MEVTEEDSAQADAAGSESFISSFFNRALSRLPFFNRATRDNGPGLMDEMTGMDNEEEEVAEEEAEEMDELEESDEKKNKKVKEVKEEKNDENNFKRDEKKEKKEKDDDEEKSDENSFTKVANYVHEHQAKVDPSLPQE